MPSSFAAFLRSPLSPDRNTRLLKIHGRRLLLAILVLLALLLALAFLPDHAHASGNFVGAFRSLTGY
jgi:hypothetical protein